MSAVPSFSRTPRDWAIDLSVMTAVGVFLGVIGPFGSFNGGTLAVRLAYWIAAMWIGYALIFTMVRLSMRAAARWDLPVWFALAVGVAIGGAPVAFLVDRAQDIVFTAGRTRASLLEQYGYVLALSEPFAFAYSFLVRRGWRTAGTTAIPAAVPVAKREGAGQGFLDRLPPRLGRDLLCLEMEDHYVRAHTAKGSDLVLIPLKDAIAELQDVDGLQVHRSWWVARDAVAKVLVNGRNLTLLLTNGVEAPVSRASITALRAAGWLAPSGGDQDPAALSS